MRPLDLLRKLICPKPPAETNRRPKIRWHVASVGWTMRDFNDLHIQHQGPRDTWYWFPDEQTWAEWWYEAFDNTPPYLRITRDHPGCDCDAFAGYFAGWCAMIKLCNACWEVWGQTPSGYHAWNVIQTPHGKLELEPQNGDIWPLASNLNYQIRRRL